MGDAIKASDELAANFAVASPALLKWIGSGSIKIAGPRLATGATPESDVAGHRADSRVAHLSQARWAGQGSADNRRHHKDENGVVIQSMAPEASWSVLRVQDG
jgi:hypothetical protein